MDISSLSPLTEPPPVSSFLTDQGEKLRELNDGVIRVWLSSISPLYRRVVKGRTGLIIGAADARRDHRRTTAR